MALQYIIKNANSSDITNIIDSLSGFIEVFPIDNQMTGLSVPTKVIDDLGEDAIKKAIRTFDTYDLYNGKWSRAKRQQGNWFSRFLK